MRIPFQSIMFLLIITPLLIAPARGQEGWIQLFDGKTLTGLKAAENPDSFRVEDGSIVCEGPRAHLF